MSDTDYPVSSVGTAFQIIESLAELGEARLIEISEETGLSNSSVHKHLDTLQSLGYVRKDGTTYSLSLRFLGVGNTVRAQRDLLRVARPAVDNLSRTASAVTNLMVLEHGYGVYAYRSLSDHSTATSPLPVVGDRVHLHATAGGKAILSQMEWEEVTEIIETVGLPKMTDKTIHSKEELREELRSIQDRGLAFERGEHLPSVQCVASPITTSHGPVGSISVTGNIDQMSGKTLEEDLPGLVISTVNEIESDLFRE